MLDFCPDRRSFQHAHENGIADISRKHSADDRNQSIRFGYEMVWFAVQYPMKNADVWGIWPRTISAMPQSVDHRGMFTHQGRLHMLTGGSRWPQPLPASPLPTRVRSTSRLRNGRERRISRCAR